MAQLMRDVQHLLGRKLRDLIALCDPPVAIDVEQEVWAVRCPSEPKRSRCVDSSSDESAAAQRDSELWIIEYVFGQVLGRPDRRSLHGETDKQFVGYVPVPLRLPLYAWHADLV